MRSIVLMGVSGSGKSTVGALLAETLRAEFVDGDELHPAENIAKMTAGLPLTDSERMPWLAAVGKRLAEGTRERPVVVACSALKRSYRDVLRLHAPDLFIVFLDGSPEVIAARVAGREHFMPPSLLSSQYASLEPLQPDERGVRVDVRETPRAIVDRVVEIAAGSDATVPIVQAPRER